MNKVDILLLNPPYGDPAYGKVFMGYMILPPLGLAYIGTVAQEHGFSIKIYDMAVESSYLQDCLNLIDAIKPKIVGISVYTPNLRTLKCLVDSLKLRKRNDRFPYIILGGHHLYYDPDLVFKLGADYGIIGEAEKSFTQLCEHLLLNKGGLAEIPGLIQIKNGVFAYNDISKEIDIDAISYPSRSLLNNPKYFTPTTSKNMATIMASRGCPFRCNFCANSSPLGYRRRSINNILGEIEYLIGSFNFRFFQFLDDTFTYDREFVKLLCYHFIKRKFNLEWACQTRADCLDPDLISLMRESGCIKISLGLETAVDSIRTALGKHISMDLHERIFTVLKRTGIYSVALLMIGHPSERAEDLKKTLRVVKKLADIMIIQTNRIMPGTVQFKVMVSQGRLKESVWDDYLYARTGYPYLGLEYISWKELKFWIKRFYLEFYFRPAYILRWLKKIRSYKQLRYCARTAKNMFFPYLVNFILMLVRRFIRRN